MGRIVAVTKRVAEALKELERNNISMSVALRFHATDGFTDKYAPLHTLDIADLALALISGYEILRTPEDNVLDYYEKVTRFKKRAEESGNQYRAAELRGEIGGIETTLNLLGIEIEGVDAY